MCELLISSWVIQSLSLPFLYRLNFNGIRQEHYHLLVFGFGSVSSFWPTSLLIGELSIHLLLKTITFSKTD